MCIFSPPPTLYIVKIKLGLSSRIIQFHLADSREAPPARPPAQVYMFDEYLCLSSVPSLKEGSLKCSHFTAVGTEGQQGGVIPYDPTEAADPESDWLERVTVMAPSVKAAWKPIRHTQKSWGKAVFLRTQQEGKEDLSPGKGRKLHPIPSSLPRSFSHEKAAQVCPASHHEHLCPGEALTVSHLLWLSQLREGSVHHHTGLSWGQTGTGVEPCLLSLCHLLPRSHWAVGCEDCNHPAQAPHYRQASLRKTETPEPGLRLPYSGDCPSRCLC